MRRKKQNTLDPKDSSVSPHSSELLSAHCLKSCMKVWCFFFALPRHSCLPPHPPPTKKWISSQLRAVFFDDTSSKSAALTCDGGEKGILQSCRLNCLTAWEQPAVWEVKVRRPTSFCCWWFSFCNLELRAMPLVWRKIILLPSKQLFEIHPGCHSATLMVAFPVFLFAFALFSFVVCGLRPRPPRPPRTFKAKSYSHSSPLCAFKWREMKPPVSGS